MNGSSQAEYLGAILDSSIRSISSVSSLVLPKFGLYHLSSVLLQQPLIQSPYVECNFSSPFSASFFLNVPPLSPLTFRIITKVHDLSPAYQAIQPHLLASIPSPNLHPNTLHSRYTCSFQDSLCCHAFTYFSVLEMPSTFSSSMLTCSVQTALGSCGTQ